MTIIDIKLIKKPKTGLVILAIWGDIQNITNILNRAEVDCTTSKSKFENLNVKMCIRDSSNGGFR